MKLLLKKGTTSKLVTLFIADSSSSTGSGLTGLTNASSGLVCYYYREGAGSATAVTLAAGTLGMYASGSFKEVDATNMPGVYQLGLPDAALATGANAAVVMLKGATNMAPVVLEVQLTDADLHDAVSLGLTRLDAAISSRSTLTAGQVNTEVVDVMTVDTLAELSQAQPPAGPTFAQALMLLYMSLRNKLTQTSSQMKVHNSGGTVICKSATSDDGTTFTRDTLQAGP
jgi:hypothetical protein